MLGISGLAIGFVWASIWFRFRGVEPESPPHPVSLNAWDFLGCYALEIERWDGLHSMEMYPITRYLMLFPDSLDAYGRRYPTYRAAVVPIGARTDSVSIRWFTRADTLWFVWSDDIASGGAALREQGGDLTGRALAEFHSDSISASLGAKANAWKVNCYTLEPDRPSRVAR